MRKLSLFILLAVCRLCSAEIAYRLIPEPASRAIRVVMTFEAEPGDTTLRIPAWCPGFYVLREYQTKIYDFAASDGSAIQASRPDSRSWRIRLRQKGSVTVSYRVKGDDSGLGFFGVHVRQQGAFINGPAAYMYIDGRLNEKCRLRIDLPPNWDVAVPLDNKDGEYVAEGYDELADSPAEIGTFERRKFEVAGIPFEAIYVSPNGRYPDIEESVSELSAVCGPAIKMFGVAPFKRYIWFIHLAVGNFDGGLEHRASNVIATQISEANDLGTLTSHEYFHAWNVKQIRPKVLGPFDYSDKVRTGNLWFAEGVTDYYAHITRRLAGLSSEAELLDGIGSEIDSLQASRTRRTKTLEDICRQTWEDSGFGVGDLSYYTKGVAVGLIFDAAIIDATDGEKCLDDVMRLLYSRHRLPKPGYEEDGIRAAINEVAGIDLGPLYDRIVRSTAELPYESLRSIGLQVLEPSPFAEIGQASGGFQSAFRLQRLPQPDERAKRLLDKWLHR